MFDEETKEPEDMFEATDKVAPQVTAPTDQPPAAAPMQQAPAPQAAPAQAPPQSPPPAAPSIQAAPQKRGGNGIKIAIMVLGILVIIGAALLISMRILNSQTSVTPTDVSDEVEEELEEEDEEPVVEEEEEEEEATEEEDAEEESDETKGGFEPGQGFERNPGDGPAPFSNDTDKDGLTDEEEAEYGTSATNEDTDADGLFDREEIMTWETDPLNPDTDGDGYLDGAEVDAGYNPNGEGELRQIPTTSG